jgi:hypothetical protein
MHGIISALLALKEIKEVTDAEELRPKNCDCAFFTPNLLTLFPKASAGTYQPQRFCQAKKDWQRQNFIHVKDFVSTKPAIKVETKNKLAAINQIFKENNEQHKKSLNTTKRRNQLIRKIGETLILVSGFLWKGPTFN